MTRSAIPNKPALKDGYYCLRDVCRFLGRSIGSYRSVRSALRRYNIKPRRMGKYVVISEKQLQRLIDLEDERRGAVFVDKIPDGWVARKDIAKRIGISQDSIGRIIKEELVRAVFDGKQHALHPDDAEQLRLDILGSRPLPGWTLLTELRERTGISIDTAYEWIEREGLEPLRRYRNPARGYRHSLYVLDSVARHLEAINRDRIAPPGWLPIRTVADEVGVEDTQLVKRWLERNGREIRRHFLLEKNTAAMFVHSDDADDFRAEFVTPPAGWGPVRDYERGRGVTQSLVLKKVQRLGDPSLLKRFRNPRTNRLAICAPVSVMEEVLDDDEY